MPPSAFRKVSLFLLVASASAFSSSDKDAAIRRMSRPQFHVRKLAAVQPKEPKKDKATKAASMKRWKKATKPAAMDMDSEIRVRLAEMNKALEAKYDAELGISKSSAVPTPKVGNVKRRLKDQACPGVDLCGSTCASVVPGMVKVSQCGDVTWAMGCGAAAPPDGYQNTSTIAQLCPQECGTLDTIPCPPVKREPCPGVDLCGSTCAAIVPDMIKPAQCGDFTWAMGCGANAPPPDGYQSTSTVAELCPQECETLDTFPCPPVTTCEDVQCYTSGNQLMKLANSISTCATCPANCSQYEGPHVWVDNGDGFVYTRDSSLCKAAIHAGAMQDSGGEVKVDFIRTNRSSFESGPRNGITTSSYSGHSDITMSFPEATSPKSSTSACSGVDEVCGGATCAAIIPDMVKKEQCGMITFEMGCGAAPPPAGYSKTSTLTDLCPKECEKEECKAKDIEDLCGSTCAGIIPAMIPKAQCEFITWAQGCGPVQPPEPFTPDSHLGELCPESCAITGPPLDERVFLTSHFGKQLEDRSGTPGLHVDSDVMQMWYLKDAGDGKVYITSTQGMMLGARNGTLGMHNDASSSEEWTFTDAGTDIYLIRNHENMLLIDINGTLALDATAAMPWKLTKASDLSAKACEVLSRLQKGKCGAGICAGRVWVDEVDGSGKCQAITADMLREGTTVVLKKSRNEWIEAFKHVPYVWDESMVSILGTEQTLEKKAANGVFPLLPLIDQGNPYWWYPLSIIESLKAGSLFMTDLGGIIPYLDQNLTRLTTAELMSYVKKTSNLEECISVHDSRDSRGSGCEAYKGDSSRCGDFDDEDFKSKYLCCECGGGRQPSVSISGEIPQGLYKVLPNLEEIDLSATGVTGSIPADFSKLTKMQILNLGANSLTGTIPRVLSDCTAMHTLRLDDNLLTGAIPDLQGIESNASGKRRLRPSGSYPLSFSYLDLSNNLLTGTIPPLLGDCGAMKTLRLDNNQLEGTFPSELRYCTAIKEVDLSSNELTGPISPPGNGNCEALEVLRLDENKFTGSIPLELLNCEAMTVLRLFANQFTGPIIAPRKGKCALEELRLDGNKLTGTIPPELGYCTALKTFSIPDNQIKGSIPRELGSCTRMTTINLDMNEVTGPIPTEVGLWSSLTMIGAYENSLTGTLPTELGQCKNLSRVWLPINDIGGTLPTELGDHWNMQMFVMGMNNKLGGTIPTEYGKWSLMALWNMNVCNLKGPIPTEVGNWIYLTDFDNNDNQLSGTIPTEVAKWTMLTNLMIKTGKMTGTIPSLVGKWPSLVKIDLAAHKFEGIIPTELGLCPNLIRVVVSQNNLTGPIPSELGNCPHLNWLQLFQNQLNGSIPSTLRRLPKMRIFVPNNNLLTGTIPSWFNEWPDFAAFHAQNNRLTGTIPKTMVDLTGLVDFMVGNNMLTGEIPHELPSCLLTFSVHDNNLTFRPAGLFSEQHWHGEKGSYVCGGKVVVPRLKWTGMQTIEIHNNPLNMDVWKLMWSFNHLPSMGRLNARNSGLFGGLWLIRNLPDLGFDNCSGGMKEGVVFTRLQVLDLSSNNIRHVRQDHWPTLTQMNLSYNKLLSVPRKWYDGNMIADLIMNGNPKLKMRVQIVEDGKKCPEIGARQFLADPNGFTKWSEEVECTGLCPGSVTKYTVDPYLDRNVMCRCLPGWRIEAAADVSNATAGASLVPLKNFGMTGCGPNSKCSACQGDCDSDAHCKEGFRCFERNGKAPVPGCKGGGDDDVFDYDYCVEDTSSASATTEGAIIECSKCQADTYWKATDSRKRSCITCPMLANSSTLGSTECKNCDCPKGYYLPTSCYNNSGISGTCQKCPQFPIKTTATPGAKTVSQCVCNYKYKGIVELYGLCGCNDNYFMDHHAKECVRCYNAAESCTWTTNISKSLEMPMAMPGFWSKAVPGGRPDVWRCFDSKTCTGDSKCASGRDPSVRACALCYDNYYGKSSGTCEECGVTGAEAFFHHTAMLWIIFGLMPVANFLLSPGGNQRDIAKAAKAIRKGCGDLLKYVQVLGVISRFEVNFPPVVSNLFIVLDDVVSTVSVKIGGVSCITGSNSALMTLFFETLLPALVLLTICVFGLLWKAIACCLLSLKHPIPQRLGKMVNMTPLGLAKMGVAYLITFFTSLLASGFSGLGCMSSPNGKMSLVRFAHIECGTEDFWPIAGLGIVHIFLWGVPVVLLVGWVWLHTVDVMSANDFLDSGPWAFIFEDFRPLQTFWPILPLCQFFLLNLISVFAFGYGTVQLLLTGVAFTSYTVLTIWYKPYKDPTNNIMDMWSASFTAVIVIFSAGFGFQSEPGQADIAESFTDGDEDPSYLMRSVALYILIVFSLMGPLGISMHQLILAFETTAKRMPKALRPFSKEDRVAFQDMLRETDLGESFINLLSQVDDIEFRMLYEFLIHSKTTMDMIHHGGKTNSPMQYVRKRSSFKKGSKEDLEEPGSPKVEAETVERRVSGTKYKVYVKSGSSSSVYGGSEEAKSSQDAAYQAEIARLQDRIAQLEEEKSEFEKEMEQAKSRNPEETESNPGLEHIMI